MGNYVIYTDSACDLKQDVLAKWGVLNQTLTLRFTDSDVEYTNEDIPINEFYEKMIEGNVAKTAAINSQTFIGDFEKCLAEGNDVLYIGFSSGLSTTFNSSRLAADELNNKYPDRKVIVVDSLCASAGLGLLVSLAVDKKNEGASIEETASYIEEIKLNVCHWFTVNDLVYLKRGGRISPTTAFVGNMLGIKPVLHVDNEGHLVNVSKVRGRKASIAALVDKYTSLAKNAEEGRVYISHAYCEQDARELADIIESKHGVKAEIITDIGTVIGAHSGPGTLALFFIGKER